MNRCIIKDNVPEVECGTKYNKWKVAKDQESVEGERLGLFPDVQPFFLQQISICKHFKEDNSLQG